MGAIEVQKLWSTVVRFKSYLVVLGFTLVGHALGFGREISVAYYFGASGLSDGLAVGLIPITIFVSAWGGAYVNAALTRIKTIDNEKLIAASLPPLLIAGVVATLLFYFGAAWFVETLSPGLSSDGREMAITFIQVTSVGAIFVSLAAWGKGLLHLQKRFARPSTADIMPNVGFILGLILLFREYGVLGVALGGLIGYVLQLAFSLHFRRGFYRWRKPEPEIRAQMRTIFRNMLLATASYSVVYIDLLVDRYFASMLDEGSIAVLSFAHKLMSFPLYTLIFAITTVMFPNLIQLTKDMPVFKQKVKQVNKVIFFLAIFVTLVSIILSQFIVSILFQYGAFDSVAVDKTASALRFYMIGFTAHAFVIFSAKVRYALEDFRTPVIAGLTAAMCNVVLDYVLIGPLGREGLALATALSAYVNAGILLYYGNKVQRAKEKQMNIRVN